MSIELAIKSILENDGGVASLVSTRIYPVVISRSVTRPALTYQQLSARRDRPADKDNHDVRGNWQITCWAETYTELRPLVNVVRVAMDGSKGSYGGTHVESCLLSDESDLAAINPDNDELLFYGKQLVFDIWWHED
jgi:hypothetical protein